MNSGGRTMHSSDERQRVRWIGPAAVYSLVMPLFGALMIAGSSTLVASTARAQAAATVSETNAANEETGLTEIVVTARKKSAMRTSPKSMILEIWYPI